MKTYTFKVVVEPDEDRWLAYCPVLKGTTTWGYTRKEALKNLQEVIELVIEEMLARGEQIPASKSKGVTVSSEPLISIII